MGIPSNWRDPLSGHWTRLPLLRSPLLWDVPGKHFNLMELACYCISNNSALFNVQAYKIINQFFFTSSPDRLITSRHLERSKKLSFCEASATKNSVEVLHACEASQRWCGVRAFLHKLRAKLLPSTLAVCLQPYLHMWFYCFCYVSIAISIMNNVADFANVILSTTPHQLFNIGCTSCPHARYLYETCALANMGRILQPSTNQTPTSSSSRDCG